MYADINSAIYAVVIEWLYLIALALWVGGILYLTFVYLPVIEKTAQKEQFAALAALLPRYTSVAQAGMVLLSATGILVAALYQWAWNTFFASVAGRIVILELLALALLIVLSGFYLWYLLPRLMKEYTKYIYITELLSSMEVEERKPIVYAVQARDNERARKLKWLNVRATLRTERLAVQSRWVATTLRCAALPAFAIIVCTAFLFVTLGMANLPAAAIIPPTHSAVSNPTVKPLQVTAKTSDTLFSVTMIVNPDSAGANTFTVSIVDSSGVPPSQVSSVTLRTLMLDMNMGSDIIPLQRSGAGQFHGTGNLYMSGHWQISVLIHTSDGNLHEAVIKFATSS